MSDDHHKPRPAPATPGPAAAPAPATPAAESAPAPTAPATPVAESAPTAAGTPTTGTPAAAPAASADQPAAAARTARRERGSRGRGRGDRPPPKPTAAPAPAAPTAAPTATAPAPTAPGATPAAAASASATPGAAAAVPAEAAAEAPTGAPAFPLADAPQAPVQRKRGKRHVPVALVHVTATFNNTIVTFADPDGNVIAWATTGSSGFKGARKGTPYAAQIAAENAGRKAQEHGVETVEVRVSGVGSGRDSSVRAINALGIRIACIRDVTPVPHNGCRPPKRRRV